MSFINMYEESKKYSRRMNRDGSSFLGYGLYYNKKTKQEQVQIGIPKEMAKEAGMKIGDTVQTIVNPATKQIIIKRELTGRPIRLCNKKSSSGRVAFTFTPYSNNVMPKTDGTVVYPKDISVQINKISFIVPENGKLNL